jgi:hypothetical protein
MEKYKFRLNDAELYTLIEKEESSLTVAHVGKGARKST